MKEIALNVPKRNNLIRLIGTVFSIGLLVYLLSRQGWDELISAFREIPAWRLWLAFFVMMVSRVAVGTRWYVLLRSSGVDISYVRTLQINFAGLFATNFLPTTVGGDVVRLAGAVRYRVDAAISAASLVVDRLIGMAAMAMALPFGLPQLLASDIVIGMHPEGHSSLAAGLASLPLGKLWKLGLEKAAKIVRRLLNALQLWVKQPRALVISLLITWVHLLCLFVFLTVLIDGMGEHIPFWLVAGLYSIVYFVTLIPVSINGYGVQELIMMFIFSHLGGISATAGLTTALLFRTLMMLASLPGAMFVPGMLAGNDAATAVSGSESKPGSRRSI